MSYKSIFVFAGEQSGDLHGEKVIASLKKAYPTARIYGVGGSKMRSAGLEITLPMESFQVMGFVDVFLAFPKLAYSFFSLKRQLLKDQPDVVLFIDYPGFNLRLASALRKHGFKGKLCHYICPSVWAWGKKRIPKMEKILDHLFVIFPFETALFDKNKLSVNFVGHPLVQKTKALAGIPLETLPGKRVIALFPGSREKELYRNFPLQLRALKRLREKHRDLIFFVSVAQAKFSLTLDRIMRQEGIKPGDSIILIDAYQNKALMEKASFAIAKSGTCNLELALHGVPTIVTYGIGALDLFIAKNLLKINLPHYSIVNIIAKETLFPELIGPDFTEENLFRAADGYLSSPFALEECRKKCGNLSKLLGNKHPEKEIVTLLDETRAT